MFSSLKTEIIIFSSGSSQLLVQMYKSFVDMCSAVAKILVRYAPEENLKKILSTSIPGGRSDSGNLSSFMLHARNYISSTNDCFTNIISFGAFCTP